MKHTSIVLSTELPLVALPAISAYAGETPSPKVLVGHVRAISPTGKCGDNPHYTWGALLNLIGVEALCGVDGNFNPAPYKDSGITENLTLRNIPFGGKLYRIEARNGKVTATKE